jgi:hypothetical protein
MTGRGCWAAVSSAPERLRAVDAVTLPALCPRLAVARSGRAARMAWRRSSAVEQGNHNPLVGGSNPSAATIPIAFLACFHGFPPDIPGKYVTESADLAVSTAARNLAAPESFLCLYGAYGAERLPACAVTAEIIREASDQAAAPPTPRATHADTVKRVPAVQYSRMLRMSGIRIREVIAWPAATIPVACPRRP